jgi:signal transduction histidine kinase
MKTDTIKPVRWQDWTTLGIRWLLLIGAVLTVILSRMLQEPPVTDLYEGLPVAGGVVAGALIILGITIAIRQLNVMTPFVLVLSDWVILGAFVHLVEADTVISIGLAAALIVAGLLHLGPIWGVMQAIGVIAIGAGLVVYLNDTEDLQPLLEAYALPGAVILLPLVGTLAWTLARQRYDYSNKTALDRMAQARAEQLRDMEERTATIAKMSDALGGTLHFQKILDAALDIGSLSINRRSKQRVVSVVMLFRDNGRLYVNESRSLSFVEGVSLKGEDGIIGEVLREGVPVIGKDPSKDPELRELGMAGIRSVLVLPLRAHYENFGVLIYGSDASRVFQEDHVHTLKAIAIQATLGLQNAVLYRNLLEEKERIIQMEEDARKSLVRDLHDIPTQTIAAVTMRLGIMRRMLETDSGDIMEEVEETEVMSRRATEEIRHVLFKLRPLALESQGLSAALGQLADKMKKTYKQNMVVKVQDDIQEYLDDAQQGALFYLVEEAVNNARKYAEADLIGVQIVQKEDLIAVRIADNGKGFDAAAVNANYDDRGSFGMVNMRERAELLNGTLDLKSVPGKGTTITVKIPIDIQQSIANGGSAEAFAPSSKLAAYARTNVDRMREY